MKEGQRLLNKLLLVKSAHVYIVFSKVCCGTVFFYLLQIHTVNTVDSFTFITWSFSWHLHFFLLMNQMGSSDTNYFWVSNPFLSLVLDPTPADYLTRFSSSGKSRWKGAANRVSTQDARWKCSAEYHKEALSCLKASVHLQAPWNNPHCTKSARCKKKHLKKKRGKLLFYFSGLRGPWGCSGFLNSV